jgi:hypothetical protein
MKRVLILIALSVAALISIIEGTMSLLSLGIIRTHLGLNIGKVLDNHW